LNIKSIHTIYFIGAGGIGMSALAAYMLHHGKEVAGYDRMPSSITFKLSNLGMYIQFADDLKLIPERYLDKKTWIVYTPAVKRESNSILNFFLSNGYTVIKRAELLTKITENTISLAVAGTHGKTSTSSVLAHILKQNGIPTTSFLGGITENYKSNLILGGNTYSVVEADEFDRSFLQLKPNYACITSIDSDHLDIYEKERNLVAAFKEFASLTQNEIIVKKGIPIKGITYGIEEDADYNASHIRIENGKYSFDLSTPNGNYQNIRINQPGKYNVLNTVAALAMANSIGVSLQDIAKALLSYKGVQRRFSIRIQTENLVLIDDYAHHPTEINSVYKTLRDLYPKEQIMVIFQPHLYTRTRDFQKEFVQSLAQFNQVFLLPIYPAREKPIKGITSRVLADKVSVKNKNVAWIKPAEILSKIKERKSKIVLMIGAGNIGEMIQVVTEKIHNKYA